MAETVESAMEIDTLIEEPAATEVDGSAAETTTTDVPAEVKEESADIVSKAFTTVDQVEGENTEEVQYVTMTEEEAAAAGVTEEEQVVTTSLQFDPANPSVLYTADGTLINQADLSPEERALVQAALQQHLAEQEAEQQLALIEQGTVDNAEQPSEDVESDVPSTSAEPPSEDASTPVTEVVTETPTISDPVAVITPASDASQPATSSNIDLSSPSTNASQIVQSLADNVRRQQEYVKAQSLLDRVQQQSQAPKGELPEGYRYEEKIIIRQGQPQVMKMPVKASPTKRPEVPAALANLMPKIEVGKDGSQVIRIHQSQITADQLKSLQENPNVRLVFRPANSSKSRVAEAGDARKRGRPRRSYNTVTTHQDVAEASPSKMSRYGRASKAPYYQKDYLSADLENGDLEDEDNKPSPRVFPTIMGRRGRPPLSKSNMDTAYRRSNTYAKKIEQLREQEFQHDEELNNARLSVVSQKPVLSSVELAISTRRKNRLRELLNACSEEEIMEVALPHLARVFSLWEFLIMKVEKNKLSRVYFADVYKEYEVLHRYISRLTDRYKEELQTAKNAGNLDGIENHLQQEKRKMVKVRCKKLAQSLGLEEDELEDAFITLLDAQEVPPLAPQTCQSSTSKRASEVAEPSDSVTSTTAADIDGTSSPLVIEENLTSEDSVAQSITGKNENEAAQSTTEEPMKVAEPSEEKSDAVTDDTTAVDGASGGTQIIQIGTGEDKQFIEVPEGYTLIQTPEGLVMSQPGTTLSQAEDGTIYVTQEDGTTSQLDPQKGVPVETVESLLSLEGQQSQE